MANQDTIRVGIVGRGSAAQRRAVAVRELDGFGLVAIAGTTDGGLDQGRALAERYDAVFESSWDALTKRDDVDLVIVATINRMHFGVGMAALNHGKHVLIEKPLACTVSEARQLVALGKSVRRIVKTGFNHRHHPWVQQAYRWICEGRLGRPISATATIGHAGMLGGGRRDFDRSWFADPLASGGGTLLDNGLHAHDLVRWCLGIEFGDVVGTTITSTPGASVEDNAAGVFRTEDGKQLYLHHSSWTRWGDYLELEFSGSEGTLRVEHGNRTATHIRSGGGRERIAESVAFDSVASDRSWALELEEQRDAIREGREPLGNGADGFESLVMSAALYRSAQTQRCVQLDEIRRPEGPKRPATETGTESQGGSSHDNHRD